MWSLGSSPVRRSDCPCAGGETERLSGHVFICLSQDCNCGPWKGGGPRESLGTHDDYQQLKLKVEACLGRAAPDSFSGFETTLCFYSSPPLEESVCWRGVLKAAPVKAAIITPRG